ncbi:hypothetical protein R3P38DRAFT_3202554 [Favolaschia claudopus]|uniref:Uncharacterized protein n=1 Tax=Favolaschia claudopus TaxID=2862362 RepID=A0AAW0AVN2_9AGAR
MTANRDTLDLAAATVHGSAGDAYVVDASEAAQSALVSMATRSTSQLASTNGVLGGNSASEDDADAYEPFIASLANNWDHTFAEGSESVDEMKAELGSLTQGDFITVDFLDAATLLGSYLEARHAMAGDDPIRDLESMQPRYYIRRSRRLRAPPHIDPFYKNFLVTIYGSCWYCLLLRLISGMPGIHRKASGRRQI